jgi:hypothetical protein
VPFDLAGRASASAALLTALCQYHLLRPAQLWEVSQILQVHSLPPKDLARELIRRDWLTPFQANRLLQGRGQELVLGQYLLLARLGEGGSARVFKARHRHRERVAAIKLVEMECRSIRWSRRHRHHTPASPTRDRLEQARSLPADTTAKQAAKVLGNGMPINSVETVPFAVWCASRYLGDYQEALWAAASVGGDKDTNCAIIGGIIALATGSVPAQWLQAREKLHLA